tara:strand:+ start:176 stop:1159 length:984 start_codon:yes stop_codon:yes gene_type:complete
MDYINYVKQYPLSMLGMGGMVGGLAFQSTAETQGFYGTRGVYGGGTTPGTSYKNVISYRTISTSYIDNTDFGDLSLARKELSACSNVVRGVFVAGYFPGGGGEDDYSHTIDYITVASTGNASDFGDITHGRSGMPSVSSGNGRAVVQGGFGYSYAGKYIEYFTIDTTGNANSFGVSTGGNMNWEFAAGMSDGLRGLLAGRNPASNYIDYVTIATTGNGSDFGNLSVARYNMGGAGNDTRGIFAGGNNPNGSVMDYVTIQTTSNAADFGDIANRDTFAGSSNGTLALYQGESSSYYVTMGTLSDAQDNGDLSAANKAKQAGMLSGVAA